ncbi:Uncharacterized protein TCM_005724 [Theobroma cacao]|uniref:Uncharacterized protein n=1 Tax=Theobroma cacao TaxID=3641 RepID=A0A061DUT7_THECC|nr:Uncharacterized protein TCM_005724 [Theobroma cacao]
MKLQLHHKEILGLDPVKLVRSALTSSPLKDPRQVLYPSQSFSVEQVSVALEVLTGCRGESDAKNPGRNKLHKLFLGELGLDAELVSNKASFEANTCGRF